LIEALRQETLARQAAEMELEQERQRAEQERQRTEQERQRAEQAELEAQRLREQLRLLASSQRFSREALPDVSSF
jgi:hypothetical protein